MLKALKKEVNDLRKLAYLHTHTVYSEKDGSATVEEYVKKIHSINKIAGENQITALAITEHGNLHSIVKAYNACNTPNDDGKTVKYIVGYEAYHCESRATSNGERYHMVLLAKNQNGLTNIYQIATDAGLHKVQPKKKSFYITEEETFRKFGKGIIASSGCISGIIPRLLNEGKYDLAKEKALLYQSYFDEFYLEVQPNTLDEQLLANKDLVRMSKETGIPLVMTCDAHYIEKTDKQYNDILKEMNYHTPFSIDCHLHSVEEMEKYCIENNIPLEAIDNTVLIAEKCNADPKPKDPRGLLPEFPVPKGYTPDSYLREKCLQALPEFVVKKKIKDFKKYADQLYYELDVICSMGFASYFLILWDWFLWCRDNKILMGPGRGSAAGSVVSYLLNITTIDPIKNGYYFERFLNTERIEYPDKIIA